MAHNAERGSKPSRFIDVDVVIWLLLFQVIQWNKVKKWRGNTPEEPKTSRESSGEKRTQQALPLADILAVDFFSSVDHSRTVGTNWSVSCDELSFSEEQRKQSACVVVRSRSEVLRMNG